MPCHPSQLQQVIYGRASASEAFSPGAHAVPTHAGLAPSPSTSPAAHAHGRARGLHKRCMCGRCLSLIAWLPHAQHKGSIRPVRFPRRPLFGLAAGIEDTGGVTEPTIARPDLMSARQIELIAGELNSRGAGRPCHRCNAQSWSLENGLVMQHVQEASTNTVLGGPAIPMALVICTNCGAANYHALGALGLLDHPEFGLR